MPIRMDQPTEPRPIAGPALWRLVLVAPGWAALLRMPQLWRLLRRLSSSMNSRLASLD